MLNKELLQEQGKFEFGLFWPLNFSTLPNRRACISRMWNNCSTSLQFMLNLEDLAEVFFNLTPPQKLLHLINHYSFNWEQKKWTYIWAFTTYRSTKNLPHIARQTRKLWPENWFFTPLTALCLRANALGPIFLFFPDFWILINELIC